MVRQLSPALRNARFVISIMQVNFMFIQALVAMSANIRLRSIRRESLTDWACA
jgi:hypothetical protein